MAKGKSRGKAGGKGGGKGKGKKGGGKGKGKKGRGKGRGKGSGGGQVRRELAHMVGEVLREAGEDVDAEESAAGEDRSSGNNNWGYPTMSRRQQRQDKRKQAKARRANFFGEARRRAKKEKLSTQDDSGRLSSKADKVFRPPKRRRRDQDDEEITSEEDGHAGTAKPSADDRDDLDGEGEEESAPEDISEAEDADQSVEEELDGEVTAKDQAGRGGSSGGAYVPPHLRAGHDKSSASQKQLRSIMNRVTEGNLEPSARELCNALNQLVPDIGAPQAATTLAKVLMPAAVGDPNISVLVLGCHAALVAAAQVLYGPSFGAMALLQIGEWLRRHLLVGEEADSSVNTEALIARNCITFAGLLFSFKLLPGSVITDIVHFIFLEGKVSELRVDLALTILRYAGKTLRGECAEDFKATLSFVGNAAAKFRQDDASASQGSQVRTRIDYLTQELQDLKNNKVSFAVMDRFDAIRTWLQTTAMLGGKKVHDNQLTVPFRFLKDDVPHGWPVGGEAATNRTKMRVAAQSDTDPLRAAAEAQRLSTELRQSLFVALMGASDVEHATQRLATVACGAKSGAAEACVVLFHCAIREKAPNAFYEHVARRLSARPAPWGKRFAHGMKRASVQHLQQAQGYGVRAVVALAELCAGLMADRDVAVPLAILRFVRFGNEGGGILGLLMRHLLESLLRRLVDAETIIDTFQPLSQYEDVREGVLLVLDGQVRPRLPPRKEAPQLWASFREARKALVSGEQQ